MRLLVHALSSVLSCVAVCGLYSQDCGQSIYEKVTDDFYFTASSDKGAVGDVIAIDISLTVENFPIDDVFSGFGIAGCYDDNIMELVAGPQYSIAFDEISAFSTFHHDRVKRNGQKCGGCFVLGSAFGNADVGEKTVVVGQAFQVGTLFFRLKGKAGDTSKIEFCDNALRVGENDGCDNNLLYYYSKTPSGDLTKDLLYALSTRHQPGVIEIVPGVPTRPDPPPLPPLAKVYPVAPTAQDANIAFELTGAVAQPGAADVSLRLYVSSNYEFSGYSASIAFPNKYLSLTGVDQHVRHGVVRIDNETGTVGIFMANSNRRIGAEGERVRLASLHFSVKETAAQATEVVSTFENHGPFTNSLVISYQSGVAGELPIQAHVDPVLVTRGLLRIQTEPTFPGDANLDYHVNLTDAVGILGDLFLGTNDILCPEAADFDGNKSVNITDAIDILNYLFVDSQTSLTQNVYCDG